MQSYPSPLIWSIHTERRDCHEVELCMTHADLARLGAYCAHKNTYRRRGLLQGRLRIAAPCSIPFEQVNTRTLPGAFGLDSRCYRDRCAYTIHPELVVEAGDTFCHSRGDDASLHISCPREVFEDFFRFLQRFAEGYWGYLFHFTPDFYLITSLTDAVPADYERFNHAL